MPPAMTLEEFAVLVDVDPAEIRELAALSLLDPARRGSFDELDLLRLHTVRHWKALGYGAERLAEALRSGEVRPFLGDYIFPRGPRLTLEQAAERTGLEPELVRELRTALGWSRREFVEEDLPALEGFKAIEAAGLPRAAILEGARVFGDALRRLAETEIRLVHVHVHERLIEEGLAEEEVVRRIQALQDAALPLLDGIVERVHHEHFLQAEIEDAYVHLVDPAVAGGRGSVETTIAFVDIESFTQLAQAQGDQAAIDTMTRVDAIVRSLALDHQGKVVKQIGDALMLAFRRPDSAVAFALALQEAARQDRSLPGLRVGMHSGVAIYRAGDYIGTTVNLASRVTATAAAGQTIITDAVVQGLDDPAQVEALGVRALRGVERPVPLYRLLAPEAQRDPACGELVQAPPAARLRHGDEELWFCSERCLRQYLAASHASVP